MHNFRVYWISLYIFRTVFPSIIRGSRLYTQHQVYVIQVSWLLASGHEMERSPALPRTQHDYHHDTKVKPEAATAVIELLMMGGKTPESFWAVNKRQDNKLKNFCIKLVIRLNCTMMHGLTNLKFYISILAQPVCKMWIIHEPKKVALWNIRHFEENNGECAACLKYWVLIVDEKKYIKCNIWRLAVRPSYI